MRYMGVARILGPAVALALVVSGCGLGEKTGQAARIHNSPARAATVGGTASGLLMIKLTPDPDQLARQALPEGAEGLEEAAEAARPILLGAEINLRVADRVAAVTVLPAAMPAEAEPPGGPTRLFHDGTVFVKRTTLRPTERRVWAKLDFRQLPDDEPRPPPDQLEGDNAVLAAFAAVNPAHVLDLAGGALPGSVNTVGREDVAGVSTTRYKANVSLDRALEQLDLGDEATETRRLMMRLLLGSNTDVRPAQFWIDDDGLLRRATFAFKQRVSRNETNDLDITIEIPQYGGEVAIPSPTAAETVEVERFGRLVRASLPARG